MDFKSYMSNMGAEVDQAIQNWLPISMDYPEVLNQSMRYSLFAKGKRLRPILLLGTTEAICGEYQFALPAACAIEMIHTYSLIHDDLPTMDNDDMRRGVPTNHRVYGEANALLAGDALLTHAFYVLASMELSFPDAAQMKLALIQELARASGHFGMVKGQVADLLNEGRLADEKMLHLIHHHKTGALLRAAVKMGAILGQATGSQIEALEAYAIDLGLAFQIVDDILDVTGDPELMGKSIGADEHAQKSTFVSLHGVEESRQKAKDLIEQSLSSLHRAQVADESRLTQLAHFVIERVW